MKIIIKISLSLLGILLIAVFAYREKIYRLNFALKMFSGEEQVERFRSTETYFPTNVITASKTPSQFSRTKEEKTLPENYTFSGETKKTQRLLDVTDTTGLLVIKNDTIAYEKYFRGNTENSHTIAWSVTKSFVSALMGIAIEEGYIKSIQDKVIDYVPELKNTAYENITLKNILQMSSGVSWDENYSDFNSDINRFGRTLALGGSFEKFVKSLGKESEQGTHYRYSSADTQVLGMIIANATKRSLSDYLEEKIWQPIGMERNALWIVDDQGNEFSAAGLNASLRDYARFGRLYLHKGNFEGKSIVPSDWVTQSLTPDAPHLLPGYGLGYGFQWWIPAGNEGEFMAVGICNQFIYVNPTKNVIIVKSSANSNYGTTNDESSFSEEETIEMFRSIVKSLDN